MKVSVIIPVRDESENIEELNKQLKSVLKPYEHEIIYIDDGSKDNTIAEVTKTGEKLIIFRRNFGKSAAMMAGFAEVTGDIVFTMDGDLQDDPKEIPRFIAKINEGYDLVVGWKKKRHDPISKTIPSKFFNWLTAKLTKVAVHDSNCGFKCFRKELIKELDIHGELHRYIPALAHMMGFKVTEIPVEHHPRLHGKSKYGISRLLKGFIDLLTVTFIMQYRFRPAHFFGVIGLGSLGVGGLFGAFTLYRFFTHGFVSAPAIMTALFIISGLIFILVGLLAEMLLLDNHKQYLIKEKKNG